MISRRSLRWEEISAGGGDCFDLRLHHFSLLLLCSYCSETTWLVWGLRVFFLDLPFPPSPVWVVLGAELGCVRAAGTSFDQLPEACGAVGVRSACDLLPGGSDRGLPPRSTSSTAVVLDLGAAAIGLDCSGVERPLSDLVSCSGCGGGGLNQGPVRPIWAVRGLVVLEV
ncbi:hypothetical protein ACOSQ2_021694 [Xanthoceras sorbifolium]